jgi:Uma2 family endonuclease
VPKKISKKYTYADYLQWPDEERWELIDGVPYDMSPAPSRTHQKILLDLARIVADITDEGSCETYIAPLDVRLTEALHLDGEPGEPEDKKVTTVVQPDIAVFCNEELLDERGAHGPPDIAVEILSGSTGYKDITEKLVLYERHGVREYWVVNGEAGFVMLYRRSIDGSYGKPDYYRLGESLRSDVLGGAEIPLGSFIPEPKRAKKKAKKSGKEPQK